jgi:nucleoside-diphosphate-sugar epimerase
VLGDGRLTPPLVFIDDLVDAVMAAMERRLVSGEVIQVVDPERLTQAEIIELADRTGRDLVRVPRPAVLFLGRLSEIPLGALGRRSPIAEYRLRSALAPVRCESDRAERLLGWRPRVGAREGIRRAAAPGSAG